MNKRESIAYAQVTLNFMQSSKYNGEITPETFGMEMKQAFKLYPKDVITNIVEGQIEAARKLKNIKDSRDKIQ